MYDIYEKTLMMIEMKRRLKEVENFQNEIQIGREKRKKNLGEKKRMNRELETLVRNW